MNIKNIEMQANLIKQFKEGYKNCVLWGHCPDGDVRPDELITWIIKNKYLIDYLYEAEKLNE